MTSPTKSPARDTEGFQDRVHEIIFEADTPGGRLFDVALLVVIIVSVLAVALESVEQYRLAWGTGLRIVEWCATILFTIEYGFRLYCVRRPWRYVFSFFGVIDLLSILPTYLSLFVGGAQSLLVLRILRLLRIFRVFKLVHFLHEASILKEALQASLRKIVVFVFAVMSLVLILGTVMYLVEGEEHGFTNIPQGMYWAIVTLTTVGYGDISPVTTPGKVIASIAMILGYGIIAVPTGIVTMELTRATPAQVTTRSCRMCSSQGHLPSAQFCKDCGARLE